MVSDETMALSIDDDDRMRTVEFLIGLMRFVFGAKGDASLCASLSISST